MVRILFLAFLLSCGVARGADAVVSCDGAYQAQASKSGLLTITGKDSKSVSARVDHQIDGGVFSQDDKYLVLYGMLMKADPRSPQANSLTLYELGSQRKQKAIVKRTYGAGIYSAEFSSDGEFVAVTTRLGVDILNVKKMTFESHDPTYTPEFPLQTCNKTE